MSTYCEAKAKTKGRIIGIGLASLLQSWQEKDLSLQNILNRFIQISKSVLENNEDARNDLITVLVSEPENCDYV